MNKKFIDNITKIYTSGFTTSRTHYSIIGNKFSLLKIIFWLIFIGFLLMSGEVSIRGSENLKYLPIFYLSVIIAIIGVFLKNYFITHNFLPKTTNIDLYNRFLPSEQKPAHVRFLVYDGVIDEQSIASTLLDLVDRDYLSIVSEDESPFLKDSFFIKPNLVMKRTDKNIKDLEKFEKFLIEWFIDGYGDGISVTREQLIDGLKKTPLNNCKLSPANKFSKWQELVINSFPDKQYYVPHKNHKKYFLTNIFYAIGVALGLWRILPVLGVPIGIYCLGCLIFANPTYNLTLTGINEIDSWKKLKKYLIDFSNIKDKNVEEVEIWNYYLTYSICLNINSVAAKQIISFFDNSIYKL